MRQLSKQCLTAIPRKLTLRSSLYSPYYNINYDDVTRTLSYLLNSLRLAALFRIAAIRAEEKYLASIPYSLRMAAAYCLYAGPSSQRTLFPSPTKPTLSTPASER